MSKKLSKYFATFEDTDKILTVLCATTGSISIASFATAVGTPVRKASASFSLVFSLTIGTIKKLLKIARNKKRNNKIVMLAKSKLNGIETLICQALIDLEIIHKEFKTIVNEKEKYEQMKENIRNIKSNDEKDELSENSRNIRKNSENV